MKKPVGHLAICGLRIPVCVGNETDHPDLARAYGCYDLDTQVIWIHETCPRHSVDFWLTHEAKHAMLACSGALRATAALFGLDLDKPADRDRMDVWEEAMIRILVPHLIETFGPAHLVEPRQRKTLLVTLEKV